MATHITIPGYSGSDFFDTSFERLMLERVHRVLLVCSKYDTFILEEDGRIDDLIFREYAELKLRNPPQFEHASSSFRALDSLRRKPADLVILTDSAGGMSPAELARRIRIEHPQIPIIALTPFLRQGGSIFNEGFDLAFQWTGQADILLAIVKLIEDQKNAENDIHEVGAQAILLVEDSMQFYSIYLPLLYKMIFRQSLRFMSETLNEHQQMLRLRGRPKLLMARDFEQALVYYERYKHNLLGIISDMEFPVDGAADKEAGIRLLNRIRAENVHLPFILQSADPSNRSRALEYGIGFIDKNDGELAGLVEEQCFTDFAFGDFVFREPATDEPIDRAADLASFQEKVLQIPEDCLFMHLERNDLSRWLKANALFRLASYFQFVKLSDLPGIDAARHYIHDAISSFRRYELLGQVARFKEIGFDDYFLFTRVGNGSLGGKARGIAFLDKLLKGMEATRLFPEIDIRIPRTVVFTTQVFEEFMTANALWHIISDMDSDKEVLDRFVSCDLPKKTMSELSSLLNFISGPVAVRSSSLLEDSLYQPFAGIYSTYMIPWQSDRAAMLLNIAWSIKAVFASTYFKASRAYMEATSVRASEERMAIIIQELVGSAHDTLFYPSYSGVARSLNYYPVGAEKAEEGVAMLALGLGRYVVGGGISLRFSPAHPRSVMQLSSPEKALSETQREFLALATDLTDFGPTVDDGANIVALPVRQVAPKALKQCVSYYDVGSRRLSEQQRDDSMQVITFSRILNYETLPISKVLSHFLKTCSDAFNHPVELEFAIELGGANSHKAAFYLLQVRPMLVEKEGITEDSLPEDELVLVRSDSVLGNGRINGVTDFVYVKPDTFNSLRTNEIAESIQGINDRMAIEKRHYVIAAPGRWGSSDPNLGIPVKWQQISHACLLVEVHLLDYRIEPSQGTHFFHNITTLNIGYFPVTPFQDESFMDFESLAKQPVIFEDEFLRHVRTSSEMQIRMDGRSGKGLIALSI